MFKGRTEEQKLKAAQRLRDTLCDELGCTEDIVSVTVEDYTPEEWPEVFKSDIADNPNVIIKPNYKPEGFL